MRYDGLVEPNSAIARRAPEAAAAVPADRPAIAVAEAMARHRTNVCYVTDGGKLAGIVTLPHFLNKVFRD